MDEDFESELKKYKPNPDIKNDLKDLKLVIIVGPSGAGKNTLSNHLVKDKNYRFIVTHTTRKPRKNHGILEKSGKEYHFVTKQKAIQMLKNKDFVEAAINHGNLYGTSVNEFKKTKEEGKIGVMDIDVQGVRVFKALSKNAVAIFLLPPSFKVLMERFSNRYGHIKDDKDINIRLNTALFELNELLQTTYYLPIINDGFEHSIKLIKQILNTNQYEASEKARAIQFAKKLIIDIEKHLDS